MDVEMVERLIRTRMKLWMSELYIGEKQNHFKKLH